LKNNKISDSFKKYPYGQILKILKNSNRNNFFSLAVRKLIQNNKETDVLLLIASKIDQILEKYRSSYEIFPKVLTSNAAKIIGCNVKAKIFIGSDIDKGKPLKGCMSIINREFSIYITPGGKIEIVRLTVAHEIVHTLFYTEDKRRPGGLPADMDEEILCEYGAGRLILPKEVLIDRVKKSDVSITTKLIMNISKKNQVPIITVCQRLMDPYIDITFNEWEGAILWGLRNKSDEIMPKNIVPKWSVTRSTFIPLKKKCHVSHKGVIYNTFMHSGSFIEDLNTEDVEIGSLQGKYNIETCGFGDIENKTRFLLSIFKPIQKD